MKHLFFALSFFFAFQAFGQDTTYFNTDLKKVRSTDIYDYYDIVTRTNGNDATLKRYFKSGRLKSEQNIFYKNKVGQFVGGRIKEWYDNGQLRRNYFYKGTLNLDGLVESYFKNGKIKRKDIYADGKLVEGHIYSEDGIEVPHSDFIIDAEFPGGNNALLTFLLKNIKYPKSAKKNDIEGTVHVKFKIATNGNIQDAEVVKSVNEDLDKEALRLVNKMPKWSPYIIDGELSETYFMLPVTFALTDD